MLGATDVMPNYVQRLAVEGSQFTNAFVGSPKCCPSRTSMLSGRFIHRLNDANLGWCGDFISKDRDDSTFLAQVKGAGYSTGLAGKLVNAMGPMCDPAVMHVPNGFNTSEDDLFVSQSRRCWVVIIGQARGRLLGSRRGVEPLLLVGYWCALSCFFSAHLPPPPFPSLACATSRSTTKTHLTTMVLR